MNSKSFAYRVFVFLVVMGAMWSTGACSDNSAAQVSNSQPDNAAFIQAQVTSTSAPRTVVTTARPSPTPTEIPLILPTPTEVGAGTPLPTNLLLPPPTITPTATPTNTPLPTPKPTSTPLPPPTPTPTALIRIGGEIMEEFPGYTDARRGFLYPLTNQCIRNAFLTASNVTKPANPFDFPGQAARASEGAWFDAVTAVYVRPPVSTEIQSTLNITGTIAYQTRMIEFRPDLVLMWHVLNNLTIQLIDPDTDPAVYQRAYEESVNIFVDRLMKETRARVVIGNVPDITAMWYFKPCFSPEVLRKTQQDYNKIIDNVARRNPNRVFVADLTSIELAKYAQYISIEDGFFMTVAGHREVAKIFGKVINRLGITPPLKEPSLYYPGSPVAGNTSSGGGGSGATTPPAGGSPGVTTAPGATTPPAPTATP